MLRNPLARSAASSPPTRAPMGFHRSLPGYEPTAVIDGYSTLLGEIDDAHAAEGAPRPDAVLVPIGVGAPAAAIVRHASVLTFLTEGATGPQGYAAMVGRRPDEVVAARA